MKAADILTTAAGMVSGERAKQHGDKAINFANIAALWNEFLSRRRTASAPLTSADVALMMVLFKVARTQTGQFNIDNALDIAGYSAIFGELSSETVGEEEIRSFS